MKSCPTSSISFPMIIKIYFGDKPVYLCTELDATLNALMHQPETILLDEVSAPSIHTLLHEIVKPQFHQGILIGKDLQTLKKLFFRHFTIVTAAGGVVENEHGEILLIFRKGKWDLPKGKQDPGESLEACAVREVEEETGLRSVRLAEPITVTYHTYEEHGKQILKDSHWYKMYVNGTQELIPQTEEDIHEIRWVEQSGLARYAEESYPSIRDVLNVL